MLFFVCDLCVFHVFGPLGMVERDVALCVNCSVMCVHIDGNYCVNHCVIVRHNVLEKNY